MSTSLFPSDALGSGALAAGELTQSRRYLLVPPMKPGPQGLIYNQDPGLDLRLWTPQLGMVGYTSVLRRWKQEGQPELRETLSQQDKTGQGRSQGGEGAMRNRIPSPSSRADAESGYASLLLQPQRRHRHCLGAGVSKLLVQ